MKPVNLRRHGTFSLTKVSDLDIIPSCSLNQLSPVEREVMRKKYLLSLENRSSKELVEEEALYVELKRIEQNEKRFKQDRERLLRTLLGAESGLPDLPIDEDGPLGDPKKRKKGVASELDSPATPSSSLFASAIPKRAQSAKSAAHGTSRHHIRPLSLSLTGSVRCTALHPAHRWHHSRGHHHQSYAPSGVPSFVPPRLPQSGSPGQGLPDCL